MSRWRDHLLAWTGGVTPRLASDHLLVPPKLVCHDAHFLERLAKCLRHLSKGALAVRWAGIAGQIIEVGRAQLSMPKPFVDHLRCQPRKAVLAANMLLSHARCGSGGEYIR